VVALKVSYMGSNDDFRTILSKLLDIQITGFEQVLSQLGYFGPSPLAMHASTIFMVTSSASGHIHIFLIAGNHGRLV
jgi:hypothetical protein